jgi:hypothetical protein
LSLFLRLPVCHQPGSLMGEGRGVGGGGAKSYGARKPGPL